MRNLWRRRQPAPPRMLLPLCLLMALQLHSVISALTGEESASLRSLETKMKNSLVDAAPPVFCMDVGVEIAFPSRDMEDAMGSETEICAGKGCLRSSPMNAVMGHLKTSLRTFSLHAVDCVLEPMDVETSTIALLGVASLCSRSNMDVEEELESWGRDAKRQVDKLFETEKRVSFKQTTGMVRRVPVSPAYELPTSGNGLPQFILGETTIWSDGEDKGEAGKTKDQTFFTHVQLHAKNDGKIPLHLYRLTLVELKEGHDKTMGFVLPLVAPAAVQPGKSEVFVFTAITGVAVDSSKRYLLYISHSGVRSHVFEGILDGKTFLSREEAVQPQGEDGLYDRFSLDSESGQSLFSSFPYATWQVGSMAVAVAVGLAVALYIRRKRLSVRLMGHVVTSCFRSPAKKKSAQSGGRTSAKPVSNRVTSGRAAVSKRGEGHIEMESLIKKPTVAEKSHSSSFDASSKLPAPPRSRMPAITMKWKAPTPPPPRVVSPVTKHTSLTVPTTMETDELHLDLDRKARLHPKRFESMWDEYVERFQSELPDVKRPDSGTLLKNMEAHGISCIASGTVNVTVDVTVATATTVLTVRTSSDAADELVVRLVDFLKDTIATDSTAL